MKQYYILELERLTYNPTGKDYYRPFRYAYTNKKKALSTYKIAKGLDGIRKLKLTATTPNERMK